MKSVYGIRPYEKSSKACIIIGNKKETCDSQILPRGKQMSRNRHVRKQRLRLLNKKLPGFPEYGEKGSAVEIGQVQETSDI